MHRRCGWDAGIQLDQVAGEGVVEPRELGERRAVARIPVAEIVRGIADDLPGAHERSSSRLHGLVEGEVEPRPPDDDLGREEVDRARPDVRGRLARAPVRPGGSLAHAVLVDEHALASGGGEPTEIRPSEPSLSSRSLPWSPPRAQTLVSTRSESKAAVATLYPPLSLSTPALFGDIKGQQFQTIAQVKKMFILAQSSEALIIVDQHAAAERVNYEKLFKKLSDNKPQVQMLLVPFTWEVALSLQAKVKERLPVFQSLGFLMESFGENAFLVRGYPTVLGEKYDLASLLDGISEDLHEKDFQHRLAAMTACKASVRAGDVLGPTESQALLDQIVHCDAPMTCPHGRPTTYQMSFTNLEHKFRRL